jgi:hypothetical protein
MLDRDEYVEQAHLFGALGERTRQNIAMQDLLGSVREEILATTNLPMAIDYLAGELRHAGVFSTAMAQLAHYFTPFQTFVVREAENDRGRFDLGLALEILRREALYRAEGVTPQGLFVFQFESISRNRLNYDRGLEAMSADPTFDEDWRQWILTVRRQVGWKEIADMIYVRSDYFWQQQAQRGRGSGEPEAAVLFGVKEGKIALANRSKDPLLLFAALHRHLGYPEVPRPAVVDDSPQVLPQLMRRVERLEARLKLLQDEAKGGIDLSKFFGPQGDLLPPE